MAAAINSSVRVSNSQNLDFKRRENSTLNRFSHHKITFQRNIDSIALTYQTGVCGRKENPSRKVPFVSSSSSSTHDSVSASGLFSSSDVIVQLYSSINRKNLGGIKDCFSTECLLEDFSFPQAFQGRKEAMRFFDELTKSMGQNLKFQVETFCEGDNFTAAVNWHLEWKDRRIPFTRGCSFYELVEEEQRLVIRKARILIESPIKPGGIVLTLLKNVTFLFDEFPGTAEWFLEKPYAVVVVVSRMYGLFMAPVVNHILSGYLKLLNCVAEFILLILKIVSKIRSLFPK